MEQQLPDCWLCLPRLSNQNTLIDSCNFGNLQLRVQISSETQSPAIRFCKQNKGKVEGIFCAVNGSLLHDKLQTGINGVVNGNGALLASQNLADINFSVQPSGNTAFRIAILEPQTCQIKFYPGIRATPPKHEGVESSPLGGGGS